MPANRHKKLSALIAKRDALNAKITEFVREQYPVGSWLDFVHDRGIRERRHRQAPAPFDRTDRRLTDQTPEAPNNMDTVEVLQVIRTTLLRRGRGETSDDPIRVITQYWSMDGVLLAEIDPHCLNSKET